MDLIGFLLIGLIAGWIATRFMRGSSLGTEVSAWASLSRSELVGSRC